MSVRKMPGTDLYEYRFQVGGRTFRKSTGVRNKAEAERIERIARREAERDRVLSAPHVGCGAEMTLVTAVGKYLESQREKAHINKAVFRTEIKSFRWIVDFLGAELPFRDLTQEMVENLVRARMAMPRLNGNGVISKDALGNPRRLASTYVNRYVTKLLKRVYIRARDQWQVPVGRIDWSADTIQLTGSLQRTREIKLEEESAILSSVDFSEGYGACFQFALLAGMRKGNFVELKWSEVNLGEREITFLAKGGRNGKKPHTIRICDEMLKLLNEQSGKSPTRVFCYRQQRTRLNPRSGAKEVRGELAPITYSGFTSWYRKLVKRLGYDLTIHDIRRTTGSRIVRRTGNLLAASKHLGHSDISVTAKHYAHITADDMLEVLNKTSDLSRMKREELESISVAS